MRESGLLKQPRPGKRNERTGLKQEKRQRFVEGCFEGSLKVTENDEDDENDDSIGGLGRRIRKLSSRTIEFCDSIDNIQVSRQQIEAFD